MKHRMTSVAFLLCSVLTAGSTSGQQPLGPPQPTTDAICTTQDHYAQFPPGWVAHTFVIIRESNWYKYTINDIVTTERHEGPWNISPAYFCRYVNCHTLVPPDPTEIARETEFQACVNVGGSLQVDAELAFKNALLGKIGVSGQVGINLLLVGCFTHSERITFSVARSQCDETIAREYWATKMSTGFIETASDRITWQVRVGSVNAPLQTVVTYCNYKKQNGDADAVTFIGHELAPFWDTPLGEPEDRWDGVRAQPCCDYESGQYPPCCGCHAIPS